VASAEGRTVFAFTRTGDDAGKKFAHECGARWAGDSTQAPPEPLDAAILFAPVGALVVEALKSTRKGGRVVCGGIHMSDLPSFPYSLLWGERRIESVANLTRADGEQFLQLAGRMRLRTQVIAYRLEQANAALSDLRAGKLNGAAVLVP
jgi:propanol-preferring alcohol dehydrogenase